MVHSKGSTCQFTEYFAVILGEEAATILYPNLNAMRKIFIAFLLLSASIMVSAQENTQKTASPHMAFKGIPIDGNINDFAQELARQGFTLSERERTKIVMSGEFLSVKECTITMTGTDKSVTLWKIGVLFPEESFWKILKDKYFELKKEFTARYGEGKSSESFVKPYKDGDRCEMQAVLFGKCRFSTLWITETGTVSLEITSNAQVCIEYKDSHNMTVAEKERKEMVNEI